MSGPAAAAFFTDDDSESELKHEYVLPGAVDAKVFLHKSRIGRETLKQVQQLAVNPVVSHARFMPDCHFAHGCCVGMTSHLGLSIQPALLGSDLGCGILTSELKGIDRVDALDLARIDRAIREAVPVGSAMLQRSAMTRQDWTDVFAAATNTARRFAQSYQAKHGVDVGKLPLYDTRSLHQLALAVGCPYTELECALGTLGGGNHYIELNQATDDCSLWVTIHCGSRTFGQAVCRYHQGRQGQQRSLSGPLAYAYFFDLILLQHLAMTNRRLILRSILRVMANEARDATVSTGRMVESVHNYVDFADLILRKGAVSLSPERLSIISLNMREGLWLCKARSQDDGDDWNHSGPHGLGRMFGRAEASTRLDLATFRADMVGVYSTSVVQQTLDESPMAYKPCGLIQAAVASRVEIIQHLKPILNIKALS